MPDGEKSSRFSISKRDVITAGTGFFIGSALTGLGYSDKLQRGSNQELDSQNQDDHVRTELTLDDRPAWGPDDSRVTIVYWGDYQCPFCSRFESQTLPVIRDNYISGGDVQFIFKPLAVFGDDSLRAAITAHCIWDQTDDDQSSFWEWHYTFKNEFDSRNSGWASMDNVLRVAGELSQINADDLQTCLSQGGYRHKPSDDNEEGQPLGLNGTPFFVLYNEEAGSHRTLSGAQPYERFQSAIDSLL